MFVLPFERSKKLFRLLNRNEVLIALPQEATETSILTALVFHLILSVS